MKQWKSLQLTEFNGLDIKTSPINLPMNLSPFLKNVSLDTYGDITGRKPYKYYQAEDTYSRITAMERYYTKDGGKHLIVVGVLTGESELKVYAYPYDGDRKVIYEPVNSEDGFFTFSTWRDKIYFSSLEDGIRYWNPEMGFSKNVYPVGEEAEGGEFHQETKAEPIYLEHAGNVTLTNNIDVSGTNLSTMDTTFEPGGENVYGEAAGLSGLAGSGDRIFINRQGVSSTDTMAIFMGSLSSGSMSGAIAGLTAQDNWAFLRYAHDIEYCPRSNFLWQTQKTDKDSWYNFNNRKRRWIEIDIDDLGNSLIFNVGQGYTWYPDAGGAMGQVLSDKKKLVVTHRYNNEFYPINWTIGNEIHDEKLSQPPYGKTESHWLYTCWDDYSKVIWALASESHWSFDATKIVMVSRNNEELYELEIPDLGGQARGIMWQLDGNIPYLYILVRRGANSYQIRSYRIKGGTVDAASGWRTAWYGGYGLANWFGTDTDDRFKVMASHEQDLRSLVIAEDPDKQQNISFSSELRIEKMVDDVHFQSKGIALIARENNGNSFGLLYDLAQRQLEIIKTYQGIDGIEYDVIESVIIPQGIVDHIAEGYSFNMEFSLKDNKLKGVIMPGEYHWAYPDAKVETEAEDLARPGYCGVAVFGGNFKASFKDIWGTYEPVVTETTIAQGKYIALHNNRLFVANTTFGEGEDAVRNPSDIRFSELGKHDQWFREVEGALIANTIKVSSQDGDEITGLVPVMGELFVLKGNSIWILYGTGPHNFQLKQILPSLGCIAPRTLATYQNKVIFLSHAGIVMMDEGGVQIISDPVEPALRQIKEENLKYCVGGIKGNQYWFSFQKEEDLPEPIVPITPTHITVRFSGIGEVTMSVATSIIIEETIQVRFSGSGEFSATVIKET